MSAQSQTDPWEVGEHKPPSGPAPVLGDAPILSVIERMNNVVFGE
jgi:hypothetical protein